MGGIDVSYSHPIGGYQYDVNTHSFQCRPPQRTSEAPDAALVREVNEALERRQQHKRAKAYKEQGVVKEGWELLLYVTPLVVDTPTCR